MNHLNLNQIQSLRCEMLEISRRLFARRLTSGTSGNISMRIPGCSENFLIKASGKSFEDVTEDEFLLVDFAGKVLLGDGVPSMETSFHQAIYAAHPDVHAIVHGHSVYATAYVMAKGDLPIVTIEAQLNLKKIGIVGYALPGSKELAAKIANVFQEREVCGAILCDHGFVTLGETLKMAYYRADALEENAKVAYLRDTLGVRSSLL